MELIQKNGVENFSPVDINHSEFLIRLNDLFEDEQFKMAQKLMEASFVKYSQDSAFLQMAAKIYGSLEKYESEARCLEKLIEIEEDAQWLLRLSDTQTQMQDFPKALKSLHRIIDLIEDQDPILFKVYKNMGNLYLKCGDMEAAEEKYHQAFSIDNTDESLMVNYGVLFIQKGDFSEAKSRFSGVLEKNKSSDLAWVGLALVHRAFSDNELARACMLRGLDENPYNKVAIVNYKNWCDEDGVDTSLDFLSTFLSKYPDDEEIKQIAMGANQ